jgi:hypothetical protein
MTGLQDDRVAVSQQQLQHDERYPFSFSLDLHRETIVPRLKPRIITDLVFLFCNSSQSASSPIPG